MEDFSGLSQSCHSPCYAGPWDGLDGSAKGSTGWNGAKMVTLILDTSDEEIMRLESGGPHQTHGLEKRGRVDWSETPG